MISISASLNEFIESVMGEPQDVVHRRAQEEKQFAESMAKTFKKQGGDYKYRRYIDSLRNLQFFLVNGLRPDGEGDFDVFRPLIERMVVDGRFKPTALEAFDGKK